MTYIPDFTSLSFYTGMISLILGVISLPMSLYFYHKANISEIKNTEILCQISNKTDMLDKITNRMLEKALGHISSSLEKTIDSISQIALDKNSPQQGTTINTDEISLKISLFNYILKTNFLAKALYVKTNNDNLRNFSAITINKSYFDYEKLRDEIASIDPTELKNSKLYDSYISNKDSYESVVKIRMENITD